MSEVIDKKIEARCRHVSQIQPANHPGGYLRRWAAEAFHYYGL
ncbi:MAG TPA: hypothetical protein VK140_03910 [Ktedonobacteraceae bacterium]|nr:hypothetical protein [Ktedonobacteraceae bacterium]